MQINQFIGISPFFIFSINVFYIFYQYHKYKCYLFLIAFPWLLLVQKVFICLLAIIFLVSKFPVHKSLAIFFKLSCMCFLYWFYQVPKKCFVYQSFIRYIHNNFSLNMSYLFIQDIFAIEKFFFFFTNLCAIFAQGPG